MKFSSSDKRLKVISYVFIILSVLVILLPLLLMADYSLKDSNAIYDYPPSLIPDQAKSVSVVIDYSDFSGESSQQLQNKMLQDASMTMYGTISQLAKSSIQEIKVYGTINGKTVFYSRAHQMQLRMELDYGTYKNVVQIDRQRLFYNDKYLKSAKDIGYTFNLSGIGETYDAQGLGNSSLNSQIQSVVSNQEKDRVLNGKFVGTAVSSNPLLLLESYKYYLLIPTYMFSDVPMIAKYSFFGFLFNTVLVIVWALLTQLVLCTLTAYALSRLFSKRASRLLMMYFLVTMMIPFICILVPQMLMMKSIGAMNNYGAMLLPYLYPSAFFIFLFKGFFDRLPQDIFDAATIDGASQLYLYSRICLPLSKPIISVLALNVIVNAWNDFFWYFMAANRTTLWTINVALYNISMNETTKENVILGLSFITVLPVIILTLIFQKQIKESVVGSAIKG